MKRDLSIWKEICPFEKRPVHVKRKRNIIMKRKWNMRMKLRSWCMEMKWLMHICHMVWHVRCDTILVVIYIYIHIYICLYKHTCIQIYIYIYVCVCIYIHICICMHTYIFIYVYIYVRMYIHKYMGHDSCKGVPWLLPTCHLLIYSQYFPRVASQSGEDSKDALSLYVIFRKRAL